MTTSIPKTFAAAALAAAVGIAGLMSAAPAAAAPIHSTGVCAVSETYVADHSDLILQQLRAQGVNATSVENWNGCIRAFVTGADGSQSMAFYDPETLGSLSTAG